MAPDEAQELLPTAPLTELFPRFHNLPADLASASPEVVDALNDLGRAVGDPIGQAKLTLTSLTIWSPTELSQRGVIPRRMTTATALLAEHGLAFRQDKTPRVVHPTMAAWLALAPINGSNPGRVLAYVVRGLESRSLTPAPPTIAQVKACTSEDVAHLITTPPAIAPKDATDAHALQQPLSAEAINQFVLTFQRELAQVEVNSNFQLPAIGAPLTDTAQSVGSSLLALG